jgi:hypothetical protein
MHAKWLKNKTLAYYLGQISNSPRQTLEQTLEVEPIAKIFGT